jgi:N utilization substance protein B
VSKNVSKKPKSDQKLRAASRTAARLAAVQALYQMDMAGTDANQVVREFLDYRLAEVAENVGANETDESYFREIVLGVVREQSAVDPVLDAHLAEGWRLSRIDSILRAILRSAAFELALREDVPARVIINEYVDIAHAFFDTEEPKVVNGILDHLAKDRRAIEFEQEGDDKKITIR